MNELDFFNKLIGDNEIIEIYKNIKRDECNAFLIIPHLKKILKNSYYEVNFNIIVENINMFFYKLQSLISYDDEFKSTIIKNINDYKDDRLAIKKLRQELNQSYDNVSSNKISKIFLYNTALTKINKDIKLYKDSCFQNPSKYFDIYFHDDNVIKYYKTNKQKVKELIKKL